MDIPAIVLLSSATNAVALLCTAIAVLLFYIKFGSMKKTSDSSAADEGSQKTVKLRRPPGPKPFPVIGNLNLLRGYELPYEGFDDLAKKYGPVISLQLGSTPTVLVSGRDNIREVLKSSDFDNRQDILRFRILAGGDARKCECSCIRLNFC